MKKIYIAPIAGVTDYTFRGILEDFKPDLIFTEMVSVNALSVLNDKTISKILKLREGNAVQIFGEDIKKIKESAKYIESFVSLFKVDFISDNIFFIFSGSLTKAAPYPQFTIFFIGQPQFKLICFTPKFSIYLTLAFILAMSSPKI